MLRLLSRGKNSNPERDVGPAAPEVEQILDHDDVDDGGDGTGNHARDDRRTGRQRGVRHFLCPAYTVPRDEQQPEFLASFDVQDTKGIQGFFDEFGFVIVRDAVAPETCQTLIDDVWRVAAGKRRPIKRTDPSTWGNDTWPQSKFHGILMCPPVWSPVAVATRTSPSVYRAFQTVMRESKLLVNTGRYVMFRPTKGHADWKTHRNLHLDMNPWHYVERPAGSGKAELEAMRYQDVNDFIRENNHVGAMADKKQHVQALINLADNREEDGGFIIVPGFRRHLLQFTKDASDLREENKHLESGKFVMLPHDSALHQRAVRVTMRAGSLLIWDQMTVHGSAPNDSNNFRFAMTLKMFRAGEMGPERAKARRATLETMMKSEGSLKTLTPLGRKLYGFDKW